MDDMYREVILDHYRNPRNKKLVAPADIEYEEDNPICGDHIHLTLKVDENQVVTEVGWDGDGCAISQASASMLYEELVGKSLEDIRKIDKDYILDMLGISLSPMRVKCATLAWHTLQHALVGEGGTATTE